MSDAHERTSALPGSTGWVCDQGDGTFDHDWQIVSDSDGEMDSGVSCGVRSWSYRVCRVCGAEDHETEVDLDDGPDDYDP